MLRILVVDDEPMIRKGLTALVQKSGLSEFHIRTAANGEAALELIREETPDILFTDIRMPVTDGLALSRAVQASGLDIDIVVISGFNDFEYARQCMALGVKDYLLKPVVKNALHEVLEKLIAARKQRAGAHVSAATLEQWSERLEQAVWNLRQKEIAEWMQGWRAYCLERSLNAVSMRELLSDLMEMLIIKLNNRGVHSFEATVPLVVHEDPELALASFEEHIQLLLDALKQKRKGRVKDPMEEAKKYIETHLSREISLEEVADQLGLNASYFSQLFKQMTGETFVQYRIRKRMDKAKKLLEQPHYKIIDISYEVGYADHPHFTKTFKKFTGLSPSEYRDKLGIK
ncbi:response regulator transcription factor [Paenibacillus agricola]|uniref:Response regulator n=1 Tax=Paenibacillus agricola TaxID=2716264 RepID=A0ABX0IX69_9BACL|nr:response regulator [Paenibacillus agricola]NHN28520.1 response regulator [Paenibacillus agricola]